MTVADLVLNFRRALVALVPIAEVARIPWRPGEAYDEWDDIATALFKGLVVEPLRFYLPRSEWERFELPAYDLVVPTYDTSALLHVVTAVERGEAVFHALTTDEEPFDTVQYRRVRPDGRPDADLATVRGVESVGFELRYRARDGSSIVLDTLG